MSSISSSYSIYSNLPAGIKAATVQYKMMTALYMHNLLREDIAEQSHNFSDFLRHTAKEIERILILLERLDSKETTDKSEIYSQLEIQKMFRDKENIHTELRSGFWRLNLQGKNIKRIYKFEHVFQVLGYKPTNIVHPLFVLLSNYDLLNQMPKDLLAYSGGSICNKLFKVKITYYEQLPDSFEEIKNFLKRSYRQQRTALANQINLDSFLTLIYLAIFQQTFLKKPRPTEAEQLAFKLFKKLFCVKYPVSSLEQLALRISQLLQHYSSTPNNEGKSVSQVKKLNYYSGIFDYYKQKVYEREKILTLKLILSEREFNKKLSKFNDLKNPLDTQKSFLTPFE